MSEGYSRSRTATLSIGIPLTAIAAEVLRDATETPFAILLISVTMLPTCSQDPQGNLVPAADVERAVLVPAFGVLAAFSLGITVVFTALAAVLRSEATLVILAAASNLAWNGIGTESASSRKRLLSTSGSK
jgi:hypothetical protein